MLGATIVVNHEAHLITIHPLLATTSSSVAHYDAVKVGGGAHSIRVRCARESPLVDRHVERIEDELRAQVGRHGPAHGHRHAGLVSGGARYGAREEGELLLHTPFPIPVLRLPAVISFGVFPYI